MSLSQPDRIEISGEMLDLPQKIASATQAQTNLGLIKADLLDQDNSLKIFFDKYNGIANAYQTERRWADGTTYSTVTNADLDTAAQRTPGNKFFPTDGSWTNFQPKKHPSSEGQPTTNSADDELEIFTDSISDGGLTALLDFLLNGQPSGVSNDTLTSSYSPGSGTMQVNNGGQSVGQLVIASGGGFSGLFLVNGSGGTTLTVSEVVSPDGTLPIGTSVKQNIVAFTNTERNFLTSASYQHVLTELANQTIAAVLLWETSVNNQLAQLNLNGDSRSPQASQITAAIADITNTKSIIDFWQALPNTGTLGNDSKFTGNNLNSLQAEITARTTFVGTRVTQITTALGSVTQNPDGTYSGSGIYSFRFQQIDSRINLAGGPLTEYYEKNMGGAALAQIITTSNNKLSTFQTELRTEKLTSNADGTNVVKVASTSGFSISDTIFVMADTFTELTGTISAVGASSITLSITVPNTYTTAKRARIYKQL